jgi:hypothetical protein
MDALLHDTSFWVAIAFIIFVVLAWRPLKKALVTALDDRTDRIRRDIDEAARLREEAQALLAEYKRKQRDAAAEAEEILRHARTEADRLGPYRPGRGPGHRRGPRAGRRPRRRRDPALTDRQGRRRYGGPPDRRFDPGNRHQAALSGALRAMPRAANLPPTACAR